MQPAFHSAFLQSLGYAIANSLWQMAIVWAVFALFNLLGKPGSAARYRLAAMAQFAGFAWFLSTFWFYYTRYSEAFRNNNALRHSDLNIVLPGNSHSVSSWIIKAEQSLPFLSIAYLFLLLFLSIRWIGQYRHSQLIRYRGLVTAGSEWQAFIARMTKQLGIRRNVSIYISQVVSSPLTVGFLKPMILIPVASINQLSIEQVEAVLLHELAHIRRYDYLWNLLLSAVETLLFFNPFTVMIGKTIRRERENSCDDYVLRFRYEPSLYAAALLHIAKSSKHNPSPAFSMNAVRNGDLLSRVRRMIGSSDNRFTYRNQLLSLLLITVVMSSLAWLHPAAALKSGSPDTTTARHHVFLEPMAVKVNNPLFNPVFFLQKPLRREIEKDIQYEVKAAIALNDNVPVVSYDDAIPSIDPASARQLAELALESKQMSEQTVSAFSIQDALAGLKPDTVAFRRNPAGTFDVMGSQWNEEMTRAGKGIEAAAKNLTLEKGKWKDQVEAAFKNMQAANITVRDIARLKKQAESFKQAENINTKLSAEQIRAVKKAIAALDSLPAMKFNIGVLPRARSVSASADQQVSFISSVSGKTMSPDNDEDFSAPATFSYPYNKSLPMDDADEDTTDDPVVTTTTATPAIKPCKAKKQQILITIPAKDKSKQVRITIVIE